MPDPLSMISRFLILFFFLGVDAKAETQRLDQTFYFGSIAHLTHAQATMYTAENTRAMESEIGFNSVKDDTPWAAADSANLDAVALAFPRFSSRFRSPARSPLLILGSGGGFGANKQPLTQQDQEIYASHAEAMAQLLRFNDVRFEIWNEWNLGGKGQDQGGTAKAYTDLVKAAAPRIRKANPAAQVIVGGVGTDPNWSWTLDAARNGLLNYGDGLSVHLYNHCAHTGDRTAEAAIRSLQRLRVILRRHLPNPAYPFYVSEFGWPTADEVCGGVSEFDAAANSAKFLIMAAAIPWVQGVWPYELKDEGQDSGDREMNFGAFRYDGSEKMVVCALRDSWAVLRGLPRPVQISTPEDLHLYLLSEDNRESRYVVWRTPSPDHSLNVKKISDHASIDAPCLGDGDRRSSLADFAPKGWPLFVTVPAGTSIQALVE